MTTPKIENAPAIEAGKADFQQRVHEWMKACFGTETGTRPGDKQERSHRFLEEALELVQACGCTEDEAQQLVAYVFNRPVGEMAQEAGGTMTTLAALCNIHGLDMLAVAETELARNWQNIEKIRAKQAGKPKCSPLPQSVEPKTCSPAIEQLLAARDKIAQGELYISPSGLLRVIPLVPNKELKEDTIGREVDHKEVQRFACLAYNSLPAVAAEMKALQSKYDKLRQAAQVMIETSNLALMLGDKDETLEEKAYRALDALKALLKESE